MTSKSPTEEQLIAALRKHHCNFTLAAGSLGISRGEIVRLAKECRELKTVQDDARGELIDIAATNIRNALLKGDLEVSRWTLEYLHPRYRKDAKPDAELEPKGQTPEERARSTMYHRAAVWGVKRRAEEGLPPFLRGPEFDKLVEMYSKS